MSLDIKGKVGWLKDENGEIFVPKTLTSAIQNAEGTNLDNLLKNLSPSPDGEGGNSQNGGGVNYTETVLYDGGYTKATNIELSDDINNYDYIKIIFGWMDGSNLVGNGQPIYITPKELEHNNSSYTYGNICTLYSTQHIWYSVTGSNYKLLFDGGSNVYLYQIIGIKFVSDSTGSSGGGGSVSTEILYTATGTSRTEIELSRPYTDFDYLDITILKYDDGSYYDFMHTFIDCAQQADIMNNNLFTGRTNSNVIDVWATANLFMRYKFTDATHITYPLANGTNTIFQVKGIKFATSSNGGGGETGILVLTPTQFKNLSPLPESGIIGVTSSDSSTLIKKFYDMSKYVDIEYDENVWNGISAVSYVNTGSGNDLIHEDTVSGYNVFCVLAENVLSSNYIKYDTLTVDSVEQMPARCVSDTFCVSSVYFSSDSGAYKATSHSEGNNWNNQAIIFAKVPWNNCEFVKDFVAVTGEKGYFEYVADKCGYYLIPITAGGQNAHSITVETDGFKKELKSTHSNGRYADLFGVFLRFGQKLKITYTVARNSTSYVYCGIYYVK